ncbi:hypothetical protein ASPVEDRAFT_711099 [Aspergillus versicolor CBS 583.65]|uniref:Fungal calcium binding protein domain-containing protein n=1 Tax=Aspergillus versicolor CBS 583.65 TaxID=1036611 RepID=A0A1L9PN70_ASPVE|nr:uncharacterized protein ASPVEDRAFT_711099 [Aspergillus versicolor CBS 583.65]OJJ02979.1 hypothetical protein ASPVEDRAFT_711099 [Aspergillus versicolor CBS 583.65]
MKLIAVTIAALSVATVQGAASDKWCKFPGQVCGKTKRAVDAVEEVKRSADALAEAKFTLNKWCQFPGQVCGKAKRAIDAIDDVKRSADAVSEAMAFLDELAPEEFQKIE